MTVKTKASITHPEVFDKFIEATTQLRGKPQARQGSIIESKFLPPLQKRYEETDGEVRKAYKVAYNTFASLRDGLKIGEVDRTHFTETIKDLEKLKLKIVAAEEAAAKKKPKPTAEEVAVNDSLSDSGEGRNGILEQKGYEVLKKYKKYEAMVPKRLSDKKRFMAIKIPVAPTTDPILLQSRLAKYKLSDDNLFGYPFIKDQVLIGINSDWVVKDFKRNVNAAVEEMLESLYEQTGTRYVQLGHAKLYGQVYYAWVATERTMRYLNQASSGGHFRIIGWDLPFMVKPKA
jgi:hypothetical protein